MCTVHVIIKHNDKLTGTLYVMLYNFPVATRLVSIGVLGNNNIYNLYNLKIKYNLKKNKIFRDKLTVGEGQLAMCISKLFESCINFTIVH